MNNVFNLKNILNVLLGLLSLFIITMPAVYLILIILILIYSFAINDFKNFKKDSSIKLLNIIVIILMIFISSHIISLVYTENISEGINLILKRIPIIIILLIFHLNKKIINRNLIIRVFVLSITLLCIYTNINSILNILNNEGYYFDFFLKNVRTNYSKLMIRYVHPPYIALIILLAFNYSIIFYEKTKKNRFLLIIFYLGLNIFLLSSKMTIILTSIILFKFILKNLFNIKILIITVLIFASFSIIINNNIYFNNNENSINRITNLIKEGDTVREYNWLSYTYVFYDNLIFGVGVGDSLDEAQKVRKSLKKYAFQYKIAYENKYNAHNQFLEELTRFGLLGGGLYIVLFFLLIIRGIRMKDYDYIQIIFILILSMLVENFLDREMGVFIFSFYIFLHLYDNNTSLKISCRNLSEM